MSVTERDRLFNRLCKLCEATELIERIAQRAFDEHRTLGFPSAHFARDIDNISRIATQAVATMQRGLLVYSTQPTTHLQNAG